VPKIVLALVALTLTACASVNPPKPSEPNENRRVPVNQTLPAELNQVPQ
jgi:hypothetical protein